MDDYIRREDAIMTAMDYDGQGNAQDASQDIAAALGSLPAVDVVSEWADMIYKHLDMEINYKKQFHDGSDTQQAFNCGYMVGLEFAKLVIKFNCGADMRGGEKDG